jgi:hypoxanthine phosphoribosyltransferase
MGNDQRVFCWAADRPSITRRADPSHRAGSVKVDGWTYDPAYLRNGDRVMLVDDIFDSGRTINHLVEIIMDKGIPRGDVRVAVHDYKVRRYLDRQLPVQPDLWCRRHELAGPEDDFWIHYLSHELVD